MNISIDAKLYATVPFSSELPASKLFPILQVILSGEPDSAVILDSQCRIATVFSHEQAKAFEQVGSDKYEGLYGKRYGGLEGNGAEMAEMLIETELRLMGKGQTSDYHIGIDLFRANAGAGKGYQSMSLDNEDLKEILKLAGKGLEEVVLTLALKGLNFEAK